MIGKDYFGKPYLYMVREKDGKEFEVNEDAQTYKARIIEHGYCIRKDAVLYNPILIWEDIPEFPNKIRAYLWLKEHINDLL
jgi:hypothetical protein